MIRYATFEDLVEIKALFDECFPEDLQFNTLFFEKVYNHLETLVFITDDKITAMLQMLNFDINHLNETYSGTYIYGACTQKEYRKNHQMAKLLNFSFEEDIKNGKHFSFLIPQEKWLFDFYNKFHYKPLFTISREKIALNNDVAYKNIKKLDRKHIPDISRIYNNALFNDFHVKRDEVYWERQFCFLSDDIQGFYGIYENEKLISYCVINTLDKLQILEIFSENDKKELIHNVMRFFHVSEIHVSHYSKENSEQFACVKIHNPIKKDFCGYLNLMYN